MITGIRALQTWICEREQQEEQQFMKFTKMLGCGNDYVYVNGFTEKAFTGREAGDRKKLK